MIRLAIHLRRGCGATGLTVDLIYDYPFGNKSMDLVFAFYDSSDATGNTWSRGVKTLDRKYRDDQNRLTNPTLFPVSILFSSFNVFGTNGVANLTNIGAFTIALNGNQASDLLITNIRTNTSASEVPEPISVIILGSGMVGIAAKKRTQILRNNKVTTNE